MSCLHTSRAVYPRLYPACGQVRRRQTNRTTERTPHSPTHRQHILRRVGKSYILFFPRRTGRPGFFPRAVMPAACPPRSPRALTPPAAPPPAGPGGRRAALLSPTSAPAADRLENEPRQEEKYPAPNAPAPMFPASRARIRRRRRQHAERLSSDADSPRVPRSPRERRFRERAIHHRVQDRRHPIGTNTTRRKGTLGAKAQPKKDSASSPVAAVMRMLSFTVGEPPDHKTCTKTARNPT